MRLRQGSFGIALALLVCLLFAGIVLGRGKVAPSQGTSSFERPPVAASDEVAPDVVGGGESPGARRESEVIDERANEPTAAAPERTGSRLGIALASVSGQLVELWEQVAGPNLPTVEGDSDREPGVLAEVPIWGGATARVRTTYDVVDLDQLKERVAHRDNVPRESAVGLSGEISFGDIGSVRIGYKLRPGSDDSDRRYVGIADAEIAYRLGDRATVGADVAWRVGAETDNSAGVSVSYQIAPNTSLRAGYHLLNFGDLDGTKEQHNAAAGIQLRF